MINIKIKTLPYYITLNHIWNQPLPVSIEYDGTYKRYIFNFDTSYICFRGEGGDGLRGGLYIMNKFRIWIFSLDMAPKEFFDVEDKVPMYELDRVIEEFWYKGNEIKITY